MTKLAVGYGEKTITPPLGIDLTGFGFYLDRRAEKTLDDLKARALFLKKGKEKLLLVSCDLLSFTSEDADRIRRRISLAHDLPLAGVMLACTHTHSGPVAQPLEGLGEADPAYRASLDGMILEAAGRAEADARECEFSHANEAVEPIGYNRRNGDFSGIDPWLKMGIFTGGGGRIFLLNYACHPVTIGPTREISADWPGALIRRIEEKGDRAIFFQGFCGDIDPVTYLNRRGGGTAADLDFYGRLLSERIAKAERFAVVHPSPELVSVESRIRLPLAVCPEDGIEADARFFLEKNNAFPGADRFTDEWKKIARARNREFRKKPYIDNVAVQAAAIGGVPMLMLPGEVFCSYGTDLRKEWPNLLSFGYANGNAGYFPTRSAYDNPDDYACYCAPKFYSIFPFEKEIQSLLLGESRKLLKKVAGA